MSPYVIRDLFCGAGGAAVGYARAGLVVELGVDNRPMPRYPFPFVQMDVLRYLELLDDGEADAYHASPPCQAYSAATRSVRDRGKVYADLIDVTRAALAATGKPWVIENVPGAPMVPDLQVCGCHVGLHRIRRVRWFECSWPVAQLLPACHHPDPVISVFGHSGESVGPGATQTHVPLRQARTAMGIDWMNREELTQAVPPAYTQLVGGYLLAHLTSREDACFTH